MLVKGWPLGKNGPGTDLLVSIRLLAQEVTEAVTLLRPVWREEFPLQEWGGRDSLSLDYGRHSPKPGFLCSDRRVELIQQGFTDTCALLIPSALRTTGFYNLCRHIAAPNSHSSGESDGRARGHLHTHSTAADHWLWFPCCEGIGESKWNISLVSGIRRQ